ncbi:MAG: outer membrane protein transport protein [Prevotella sp.]|nr:outer membrane protein transport protein [Prevotella sp.]MBQ9651187.1 outer membrane protein transport protein [Prevotella sp.]
MKKIFSTVVLAAITLTAGAQSSTNSPYSQYGLGVLSDQTSGFNRGMNGLALGFREHNQVNYSNPAAYSALDSLTFLFDIGASGKITNFKENGKSKNAKNADLDYIVAAFRAARHVGVSFGLLPFTNVGYDYSQSGYLDNDISKTYTNSYYGSGGLHEVYLGAGWEILKNFSLGMNAAYIWGPIETSVINSYSDTSAKTLTKTTSMNVSSYKLDFGAQYTLQLDKKNNMTIAATFSPGHKMNATPTCNIISSNSQTSVTSVTTYSLSNVLKMPTMLGAGLVWNHDEKWKVGADYQLQMWSKTGFPVYRTTNNTPSYQIDNNYYNDRHKIILGGQYCANENSRKFFDRLRVRAGVSYASPYLKINGKDGPKEIGASLGFGIPIVNSLNNRSILNISGQWVQQSGSGLIKENTFRINLGLTFNERWFMKWKVE